MRKHWAEYPVFLLGARGLIDDESCPRKGNGQARVNPTSIDLFTWRQADFLPKNLYFFAILFWVVELGCDAHLEI